MLTLGGCADKVLKVRRAKLGLPWELAHMFGSWLPDSDEREDVTDADIADEEAAFVANRQRLKVNPLKTWVPWQDRWR